jgi:muramoyltetrapeptide carboxypeptidase
MSNSNIPAPLKPPKLQIGDTIGIVAPCMPILPQPREPYELGKRTLTEMGFKLKEGKTINLQRWYSAGTPQQQADDINAMFADPEVKAIVSASGGHSALTVLDKLDYDLIRNNPKPFIGMSDMTCYHLALYAQCGLVGFHMDEVTWGLGINWQSQEFANSGDVKSNFYKILTQTQPLGLIPHIKPWESWKPGRAEGHLIGGNLYSMTFQMGTPYFPRPEAFDGAILFWESMCQPRYNLARSLYQLKYYGALERISGMLIGTITKTPNIKSEGIIEPTIKDLVLDATKEYNFPIMASMDFGHLTVNNPMPLGVKASFDTDMLEMELMESAVV